MTESMAQLAARLLPERDRVLLLAIAAQESPLQATRSPDGTLTFAADVLWPGPGKAPTAHEIARLGALVDVRPDRGGITIELSPLGREVAQLRA